MDANLLPINVDENCQSRNLPHWLWLIIAKSLGIKLQENDKPILATILYLTTFLSAVGFIICTWWFTAYDIMSDYTKTTIISGSIGIVYTISWSSLGMYAHELAYRLYRHPHFWKLIKLHSKTMFKMNAAVILFLLMTLFMLINNINSYSSFQSNTCETVGLSVTVCRCRYIFRIILSLCSLIWHYLVAFALTSICRSHVLRIRKFMNVLEQDAKFYEANFLGTRENLQNELPEEDCLLETDDLLTGSRGETSTNMHANLAEDIETIHSGRCTKDESKAGPPIMSNDEILFHFWKIQTDLRLSSVALQRWMMSIISMVAIWMAINLVFWLNYEPNIVDVVNFFLPVMLLPLLTSAYAEVNQEGHRLPKFICLHDDRIQLLLFLQSSPLQMTVYTYSLSYSTIGTASFGVLVALSSKILLQEMFDK